jgi:hypothetical protein
MGVIHVRPGMVCNNPVTKNTDCSDSVLLLQHQCAGLYDFDYKKIRIRLRKNQEKNRYFIEEFFTFWIFFGSWFFAWFSLCFCIIKTMFLRDWWYFFIHLKLIMNKFLDEIGQFPVAFSFLKTFKARRCGQNRDAPSYTYELQKTCRNNFRVSG